MPLWLEQGAGVGKSKEVEVWRPWRGEEDTINVCEGERTYELGPVRLKEIDINQRGGHWEVWVMFQTDGMQARGEVAYASKLE